MFKKENLKKNFFRVKQNIDQNLGRSEKSEVLSEGQQENERRVEVVKHAFQNISKKSGAVLQAQGSDFDKRLKKLPETGLGHALLESAQGLNTDSLLGYTCHVCGDCQGNLAKERVQFETLVEQNFIKPLNSIVDVDIPSIIKQRKVLNKSILDMDSAKSRFNQAMRQSSVPGTNMANAANKVDVIRDELDEAESKVESNKDNLSIELCNFTAKESEHAYMLLGLLEAQANYHRKAVEAIEACIPQLKLAIHNSPAKPCFGLSLDEHLRLTCRDIAVVLEACVLTLLEIGLEEEGLFRVAGSASKVKKLRASFDAFPFDANTLDMMVQDYYTDPHAVAGALKQYLRELPEPLLTYALHDEFMNAATLPPEQRLTTLWTIINKLPVPNYNNFRYLIKFLSKLKDKSDVNKMKASNIAIVVGPNLLWSEGSDTPSMLTTGTLSTVIDAVVTHADYFFPGADYDFRATKEGSCPKPPSEPPKMDFTPEKIGEGKQKLLDIIRPKHKQSSSMENLCDNKRPNIVIKGPALKSAAKTASSEERRENSDENNLNFSNKNNPDKLLLNNNKGIRERGHTLPTQVSLSSSYDTGDYDNIMFTSHAKSPLFRSSTVTSLCPLKDSSNTTNQIVTSTSSTDSSPTTDKDATATTTVDSSRRAGGSSPIRPSRPSKKMTPSNKLAQNFLKAAGIELNQSFPSSSSSSLSQSKSQAFNSGLMYQTRPFRPENTRTTMTGSSPNISSCGSGGSFGGSVFDHPSISSGQMDLSSLSSSQDIQKALWNRPSQNQNQLADNIDKMMLSSISSSSYHSSKRGSDPSIVAPPAATFSQMEFHPHANYFRPGPARISRSQLGQPPAPKHQQNVTTSSFSSSHQQRQQQQQLQQQQQQQQQTARSNATNLSKPAVVSSLSKQQADNSRVNNDNNNTDNKFAPSSSYPLTSFKSQQPPPPQQTGNTNKPTSDYSTKVQAMWDDWSSMSASTSDSNSGTPGVGLTTFVKANESLMKDQEMQKKRMGVVMKDKDFPMQKGIVDGNILTAVAGGSCGIISNKSSSSATKMQPTQLPHSVSEHPSSSAIHPLIQDMNFNVSGYEEDHEHSGPNQMLNSNTETPTIQVPSPGPYSPSPVSPKSNSPASLSVNISSDGSEATSPVQRRGTRKPAPPPPPERPFNVMVTATTNVAASSLHSPKPGSDGSSGSGSSSISTNYSDDSGGNSSLTWPRSAPLASPESPSDMPSATATTASTNTHHQQHRISGGHAERPNMPPPERPKLPPPVTMQPPGAKGHQRSSSTGAMMNSNLNAIPGEGGGVGEAGVGGAMSSGANPGLDLALDPEDNQVYASIHL